MKRRIGIALSGGGYRAAAFHLGTLRALDRLGILSKIDVISSVSGGSILSAYYGLHKDESFEQIDAGFRQRLKKSSLSGFLINVLTVFVFPLILSYLVSSWFLLLYLMLIPFGFIIMPSSELIAKAYDRIFFENKKLKDLPDYPIIGINSTNIVKGRLFTFSKQDVGGFDYKKNGESVIHGENIPLSFAVSCSTCVPSFFSPRRIAEEYFVSGEYRDNLLIDGGLYDNQGAYILSESSNKLYRVEDIIVSDAGNSEPSSKYILNTFMLMYQSIEVLMNRIRTIQIRKNIYQNRYNETEDGLKFAYLSLRWDNPKSMPSRFIDNLKKGYVEKSVANLHQISDDDIYRLMNDSDSSVHNELKEKFEKSIDWQLLLSKAPSESEYSIAYRVCTNLTPLSEKQINALSAYADWLTEAQVKTYLPHLIRE